MLKDLDSSFSLYWNEAFISLIYKFGLLTEFGSDTKSTKAWVQHLKKYSYGNCKCLDPNISIILPHMLEKTVSTESLLVVLKSSTSKFF